MARDDLHFRLRIPEDLKGLIERAADENRRSMTAEIVFRLANSFGQEVTENDILRKNYNNLMNSQIALQAEMAALEARDRAIKASIDQIKARMALRDEGRS